MPSVVCADCHKLRLTHYAECFYAECEYAECRYAEYRGEYYNICEEGHKPTHLQPILIFRVKAKGLPLEWSSTMYFAQVG